MASAPSLAVVTSNPARFSDSLRDRPHAGLVVDDEDARAGGVDSRCIRRWTFRRRRRSRRRQQDAERRAAPGLADDDLDRALMAAHDAEHRGQAEPAPRELGREERIEDPRRVVAASMPHAGVGHLERTRTPPPAASSPIQASARSARRPACARCASVIGPRSLADRVGGVGDQVHDHLPDLRRVAVDRAAGPSSGRSSSRALLGDRASAAGASSRRRSPRGRRAARRSGPCPSTRASGWSARPRAAPSSRSASTVSQRRMRRRAARSSARLALPRMPTSRLLKSCAMPPASTPRLSSFCACCTCARGGAAPPRHGRAR